MTVIVDDHDHRIVYDPVGLWIPEGGSLEFMATTTSSNTTGCTGNFTFLGTSITIYGSVGPGNGSSMSFRIDKSSGSYSAPALNNAIHHQTFWTSPVLPMGLHNLVITQASSASHPVIFLDYLMFETSSTAGQTLFIDDNDSSITYSSGCWQLDDSDGYFMHTAHISQSTGCSLSFNFVGNYISYHGPAATGVSGEIFNASVAIDGNSPVFVTQVNQAPATITYNNQIFSSPTLSDGNHTLVITAMNDHPLYIDYLLVSINPSASIVTSASTQPSTIQTTSPEPSASKANSISIGAIIGGSVGGLIFFTALVFAVLLARRHRQRSRGPYGRRSFIPAMNSQWRVSEYPPDDPGLFSTHPLLSLPPSNSTHSLVSTQTQFDPTLRKERPPPQYST